MNNVLALLAGGFGVVLGSVFGVGLLVPALGNAIYGVLNPRRIGDRQQRRLAVGMWAAMACSLVLIGSGSLVWMWIVIGLGLTCAGIAVGCGVRLRLLLAHKARQQRAAQEAAFRDELEQVLHGEQ